MNLRQIGNMVNEIYRDYKHKRKENVNDKDIARIILRMYITEKNIDWEEVRWLWIQYLETGNLYMEEARQMAQDRLDWEDVKATEEELIYWLSKGI